MSALGSLYIRLGEPDGELGGCCETADWAAEYIEGLLAGQASVLDVLVQEAALVGENMILKSQVAELERERDHYKGKWMALEESELKAQAGEPVAWAAFVDSDDIRVWSSKPENIDSDLHPIPLYTHPTTECSVPDALDLHGDMDNYARGWNGCRAAMLNAAPQVKVNE